MVTVKKQAVITPLNGATELTLERNGNNVVIKATFDPTRGSTASLSWNNLWTFTFLGNKEKRSRDSRVKTVEKMFKTGTQPSTLILHFHPTDEVTISTGDLRSALRAIK